MDATTTLIVGAVLVLVYLIMAAIFTRLLRHPILLVGVLLMLPFFVIFGTLILLFDGLRLLLKPVLQLGLADTFVEHGDPTKLMAMQGLDAEGIQASIYKRFAALLAPMAKAA